MKLNFWPFKRNRKIVLSDADASLTFYENGILVLDMPKYDDANDQIPVNGYILSMYAGLSEAVSRQDAKAIELYTALYEWYSNPPKEE